MRRTVLLFVLTSAMAVVALPAAAASPTAPTVSTGSAGNVTEHSASLTGTLSSNGAGTTYSFEYGTTTSYGSTTATKSAGPALSNGSVSANLTGLTPGTAYHFALVATNSVGTTTASDGTFTTATPPAPVVTTGSATAVTGTAAQLGGTVTPGGAATTYSFDYGTTTSYGSTTGTKNAGSGSAAVNASASIGGLTAGTTYHFRLVATSSSGTTDGSDATFTTTAAPTPTVVTGSATAVTAKTATLGGTVTANGAATTYSFQYGTSTSYGSSTATHPAGGGTSSQTVSANLTDLTAGTVYHYRLDATNSSGTTNGSDGTFTTTAAPVAPAPTASTGSATAVTTRSASLGGSVTANGAATTYLFEYGTSTNYGSTTGTKNPGSGSSSQTVSANVYGLIPGTTYHYRLDATDSSGTTNGSDQTFTTTTPPVAVPTVATGAAAGVTAKTAALAGSVTPNGAATTSMFEYGTSTSYGSQTASRNMGSGAASKTAFANLYGLTPGTVYHYRLVATNSAGTTDGSDQTFTTAAATTLPHAQWFAGSVSSVGSGSLTVGVLWTGKGDSALNGTTVTVSIDSSTTITSGPDDTTASLSDIQVGDLVGVDATGTSATTLTATKIHVACNCHWIGGTISSIGTSSIAVQVKATGPYDTVLANQLVTVNVNSNTTYIQGSAKTAIKLTDLKVGDGVGVVFGASGFFKSPSFDPTTATFTAKQVHDWPPKQVPAASTDTSKAATVAVP